MPTPFELRQARLVAEARRQAVTYGQALAARLWAHGFLPDKSRLYAIDRWGPEAYLSDLQREMTRVINGPYSQILNNKLIFNEVFGNVVPIVDICGYTNGQRFEGHLPDEGEVFAKPVGGGGGNGVFRATIKNGSVAISGRRQSRQEFVADLLARGKDYILTEAVKLHPELSQFYDSTTNTLRVLMMRSPDTGEGFVSTAVLRVGTKESGAVDNFSRGGISFWIDVGSGLIGGGWRKNGGRTDVHPDTGMRITGRSVPMWDEVVAICHRAFDRFRHLRYVGWDIIVTSDGPVVLEGNHYSDVNLLQVHEPLLADERVRGFYDYHGILDWRPTEAL